MSIRAGAGKAGRLLASLLLGLQPGAGALAQGQPLLPPSLPPTLPGGLALPNLPPGSQQDILQRILDAAGGRPPAPAVAPASPVPALPAAIPAPHPATAPAGPGLPAEPGEPVSNTEAFFAARLPDQQPPLRQFGYDTF